MKKSLAAELAAFDAIEVDTLIVENAAAESLTSGYGLTELGASCWCYNPDTKQPNPCASCFYAPDDEHDVV